MTSCESIRRQYGELMRDMCPGREADARAECRMVGEFAMRCMDDAVGQVLKNRESMREVETFIDAALHAFGHGEPYTYDSWQAAHDICEALADKFTAGPHELDEPGEAEETGMPVEPETQNATDTPQNSMAHSAR